MSWCAYCHSFSYFETPDVQRKAEGHGVYQNKGSCEMELNVGHIPNKACD